MYAVGLTREISRPWNGLHEWNGAIYSLFARNLLRYPWEIHHGMPVIAAGETVPSAQERSIYPHHPAGLAWLIALSFRALGECEWSARLVPILSSLGSAALLMFLVRRRWGDEIALVTGIAFSVLPMSVYFGRMVNHEPVCLFFMLAAAAAWEGILDSAGRSPARRLYVAIWLLSIAAGICVDWSGALFGCFFAGYVVWLTIRRKLARGVAVTCLMGVLIATLGMLLHVVEAGFGGRVRDLTELFFSRSAAKPIDWPENTWRYSSGNLTWPGIILGALGLFLLLREAAIQTKLRQASPLRGLVVLFATGIVWLAVFWRQFQIHNYWMFYLGPLAALGCARAVVYLSHIAGRLGRPWVISTEGLLLVVLAGFGFRGTEAYFRFQSLPTGNVEAWREVRRVTSPDERILVFRDPTTIEKWGQTRVRFINPPQFPYYADRLFDAEDDLDRVGAKSADHPLYVVDLESAAKDSSSLGPMTSRFVWQRIGSLMLFDLRRPISAPTTARTQ
jgi:hypothetical protein